jgi:hypothetical protein
LGVGGNAFTAVDAIVGGTADAAGPRVGDIVLAVDGVSAENATSALRNSLVATFTIEIPNRRARS